MLDDSIDDQSETYHDVCIPIYGPKCPINASKAAPRRRRWHFPYPCRRRSICKFQSATEWLENKAHWLNREHYQRTQSNRSKAIAQETPHWSKYRERWNILLHDKISISLSKNRTKHFCWKPTNEKISHRIKIYFNLVLSSMYVSEINAISQ